MSTRSRFLTVAVTLLALFVDKETQGQIVSPVNNHRYRSITGGSQWQSGQPLATVRSLEENNWIVETFGTVGGTPRALWIGLNDAAEEGTFAWVSGETNSFTNWAPTQPDNNSLNDYVLIFPPDHPDAGKWGMVSSSGLFGVQHSAVLEYPPLPWFPPGLDWNFVPSGSSATQGSDIALGENGEVYAVGYCGTNTFGATELNGFGGRDGYLARLDDDGTLRWVRNFGGSGTDAATGVAVDSEGNVVVAGNFQGTAAFGGTNLTATGTTDLFLSKFDSFGSLMWVVHAGSTNITSQRIAVDGLNNIYVTGYFQGTADFGVTNLTSAGSLDVFLAKFDSSGQLQWAKQGEGSGAELSFRIAVSSSGESVVTGRFNSPVCNFDSHSLTNAGGLDLFVVKYDADGNVLWARRDGGTADDWGNGIAMNESGEIFVTGFFKGTSQFDSYSLTNLSGTTYWDLFLAKYSSDGELSWVKHEGGSRSDLGNDLACDNDGNVYLVFTFYSETSVDGSSLFSQALSQTAPQIGIVKYSASGSMIWAGLYGSQLGGSDGLAVAVDESGRAYFTGFWVLGSYATIARTAAHLPPLKIQHSDSNIILSWPTNFTAFTLEKKDNLNAISWTPFDTPPTRVAGSFFLTNKLSSGHTFYRLHQID